MRQDMGQIARRSSPLMHAPYKYNQALNMFCPHLTPWRLTMAVPGALMPCHRHGRWWFTHGTGLRPLAHGTSGDAWAATDAVCAAHHTFDSVPASNLYYLPMRFSHLARDFPAAHSASRRLLGVSSHHHYPPHTIRHRTKNCTLHLQLTRAPGGHMHACATYRQRGMGEHKTDQGRISTGTNAPGRAMVNCWRDYKAGGQSLSARTTCVCLFPLPLTYHEPPHNRLQKRSSIIPRALHIPPRAVPRTTHTSFTAHRCVSLSAPFAAYLLPALLHARTAHRANALHTRRTAAHLHTHAHLKVGAWPPMTR